VIQEPSIDIITCRNWVGGSPCVSVVLPTFNRAYVLGRAVESVLSQTYRDLELVVVDDGSTDNTAQVIESFQDRRIQYVRHEHNQGAAAARNTGIRLSSGQYIAFQDSDDVWLPLKLERQLDCFGNTQSRVGVVYSWFWRTEGNRRDLCPSTLRRLASLLPGKARRLRGDISYALLRGNFVSAQTAVVRRECFERVALFDERLPRLQDWELWLRLSRHYHFECVDEPLVITCATQGSITGDYAALFKALELILDEHCDGSRESQELLAQVRHMMGDVYCRSGRPRLGRRMLCEAIRLSPLNAAYWIAGVGCLLGPRIYDTVPKPVGIGPPPEAVP
jgi:glycosyltransferase involved in cell wall biosynthesis